ncbi:MAG: hypothetical protein WKG07_04965 [Hymenobacter sp.]
MPVARRLQRFHGALDEVEAAILAFDNAAFELVAWADVLVRSDEAHAEVQRRMQAALQRAHAPRCWPRAACATSALTEAPGIVCRGRRAPGACLHELTVAEVFGRRVAGLPPSGPRPSPPPSRELRQAAGSEADPQWRWGGR